MTFDEVLTQVLALLQREKRVSYRALKLRFDINDDYIEGMKDELIYAKKLAVDEENRVLVWAGNGEGTAEAPSQPPQAIAAPLTQETAAVQPTSRLGTSRTPGAERRQLTVMFCDLVGSTKLSSQLDPEEYRDVVRAYQQVCSEVITRFDGHIAQLLGDGLLVYFGYPQAHEDDAQRAVRTGLGILDALGDLNRGLQQAKGIQLAIHIGMHTGLVVVGAMGGAGRQEQLALGEVPNIAARIEGLAAPNTVALSEATYRLVQGYFDCEALGEQTLRGVAEPLHVYRVLQESGARGRFDVVVTRGLTPLVGRESEVTLLLERWEQAKAGQGQVVLLSGDAGIGKSRLVQMLKDHVANEPHTRWECRSSPDFENTALFPLTDLFQRLVQFETEDTPDEKLGKLEHALSQYRLPLEESISLLAPLLALSLPENRYPLLYLSPQRLQREVHMSIALGASLITTKGNGAPEVEQTYIHARQLCAQLDDPHQRFPLLRGLGIYYLVRAELQTAHALGEQLLALAQQTQDSTMLVAAYAALGPALYHLGAVAAAHTHLAQGIALDDAQQHRASTLLYGEDAGVYCHSFSSWTLWYLGYPDQGLARSQGAVTLAQQSAHPFSLAFVLRGAAWFHQLRLEVQAAQDRAEATIVLATAQGFPLLMAFGSMLCGWALAHQGQTKEGIEQLTQGLSAFRATGAEIARPYFLALLAEAHGSTGEPKAGLTVLTEALTLVDTTGERWYAPELHRLKGELLLAQSPDNHIEAETCFQQAISTARSQQAKSFELRAATSLARLWHQQGKHQEAHDFLAPVYHWFTEGFDTADLKDAKALLEELA